MSRPRASRPRTHPVTPPRPGGVTVLVTGARVAAGLLSAAAWSRVHGAASVVMGADHPALAPLVDAHVAVVALPVGSDTEATVAALAAAAATGPVAYLAPPGEGAGAFAAALSAAGVETELVRASWDPPGAHLLDLVAVMDQLRSPGGCPWDAEQTHRTLAQYLLEETYEVLEALETDDAGALREELGDLLLQVVFHARVASESPDGFDIDDVADAITTKLVRRHPHVFAGEAVGDAAHTERQWDAIKRSEKGRTSALDGVPMAQPALSLAAKLMGRVERAGVNVPVGAVDPAADVGELLLQVVSQARRLGVEPEGALREAVRRYATRVQEAEGA